MRGNIVGLLTAALMGVCGVASANILYNVNLSGGGETVTGTITTDGDSGFLTAADFVSWSLAASGVVTINDAAPPGVAACDGSGCGIFATPMTLEFTGLPPEALLLEDSASHLVQITPIGVGVPCPGTVCVDAFIPAASPYLVGSVPEPPTALLLGIGLACLGLACTRARRRQSGLV
jgi:PEP-CTERM motif